MSFSFTPTQGSGAQDPNATKAYTPPVTDALSLATRANVEKGVGLLHTLLFLVFGACAITTVGLFAYSYILNGKIETKKEELQSYEKNFGELPIAEMRELSNKIKAINQLVKEHSSVRVAFAVLEHSVENPVMYKSFSMMFSESLKTYELQINAKAPSYRAVVQQIDTFKRKPYTSYVSTISVGSLALNQTGEVDFSIKMPIRVTGVLPESLVLDIEEVKVATSSSPVSNSTTSEVISPNP